ncbi:dihydroxyacetone kinase [Dictyobacter sp. S3.2.2.5]|uniref:Dihydroxyacetone kinase n=2 Tax=Dictyobacter halimunensis TaxID=3026934 RepID=A0ABQ6FUK9_9CHLR|nr:dihydroxyacetone kinase [Dictyobacter sp. S3.2.2.5]
MAATMKSAIRNIAQSEEKSAGVIARQVAHDALLGARGNSGVILSQTLRGIAAGLENKATFNAQDLAEAFQKASELAYRAVIKPVEGTILTVVREVAEAAKRSAEHQNDLIIEMQDIVAAARQAVARTPELLPTLKQAGVVDAGGQGFCTILEGVLRYMRGEATSGPDSLSDTLAAAPTSDTTTPRETHTKKGRVTIEEEFGYEVVFLLRGNDLDVETIRQTIIDMGGVSTVVAGDETMLKVHTHTLTPGKILDYGVGLGSLLDINIENLQEQSLTYAAESDAEHAEEEQKAEVSNQLATVAVVSGEGFEKVFRGLGVSSIVSGGQTMNPSIEELLDAVEKTAAEKIIILPNNSNVILSAQQVVSLSSKEVYVIPCKTLPQGIAALISFNYEADFTTNCETMTEAARAIQTAEITTAVRSVQLGTLHVREGDFIGVINGNLSVANSDMEETLHDTLQRMNINRYEIVTIYYGDSVTAEQAQETARRIKMNYSQLEIEVVDGGQPYYAYIISVE